MNVDPTVAPPLPPRQETLLSALRAADGELSGQELHARLRGGTGAMGLATVYRHLRQLQQRGLVRCRHLPSGEALYAPTERDEHHLTCVDCGSTCHLITPPYEDPDGGPPGFQPGDVVAYRCEDCLDRWDIVVE